MKGYYQPLVTLLWRVICAAFAPKVLCTQPTSFLSVCLLGPSTHPTKYWTSSTGLETGCKPVLLFIYSVIWFSIYSVLWIWSARPPCPDLDSRKCLRISWMKIIMLQSGKSLKHDTLSKDNWVLSLSIRLDFLVQVVCCGSEHWSRLCKRFQKLLRSSYRSHFQAGREIKIHHFYVGTQYSGDPNTRQMVWISSAIWVPDNLPLKYPTK